MSKDRKLNIMLADFSYFNKHTLTTLYVPLGVGLIGQYTKQVFGSDIDISIFKNVDDFFETIKDKKPDVVGLAVYYWNKSLNQYVVNRLRKILSKDVLIILGGPCIDSSENEQLKFLTNDFPNVDAIIVNEGELGFTNIIQLALNDKEKLFSNEIDGVSFLKDGKIVRGKHVGTSIDLMTVGSPYLSGLLDKFMDTDFQPLIQTSRFCPYTCAFCVSGKNRGKLRGYPIEQVKEELRYVSKKFADRPHHTMYMADENFGILKRDVEIADEILKCSKDFKYPQHIFFYNDKRFTDISRYVCLTLNSINDHGMCLSLQTENPDTLKAINRRNVTDDEIDSAIKWASSHQIKSTTELIFGLPHDTRKDFTSTLNKAIDRGFENVLTGSLFLMDGIELNRPETRKKHGIVTRCRPLGTNYGEFNGKFVSEYEEVVVASNTFSYEDFLIIRGLNFMFFSVFSLNFQKWFFQYIKHLGIKLSDYFTLFITPDGKDKSWPEEYLNFLDSFKAKVEGELYKSKEDVFKSNYNIYKNNNNEVGEPVRLNKSFGARIIYLETFWIEKVLIKHLKAISKNKISDSQIDIAKNLIRLSIKERVNLRNFEKIEDFKISHDVIQWRKNKYTQPLENYKTNFNKINFSIDNDKKRLIESFTNRFKNMKDLDFYYSAQDFVIPRESLLYKLEISKN